MIVCICNQTEGHTCTWHSVHGQFMTNFSEEQLLKEGVYDIKAVIMMMSMKHLQILLLYHLFFCCLNMIFLLDMLSTRNFFRDLFFICFEFECLFNFANHICILYMLCRRSLSKTQGQSYAYLLMAWTNVLKFSRFHE